MNSNDLCRIKEFQYKSVNLPYQLVNIILQYDGRITYKYKRGSGVDYHKYVNVIHQNDSRYDIITPIVNKKKQILKNTETSPTDPISFYFEFAFDSQPGLMLCYDYNWSFNNQFEICHTDMKGSGHFLGSDQIRYIYK